MRERSPSPLRGPLLRSGALERLGTWGSRPPALPAHRPARPAPQMPAIVVLAAAAAAWCFLQVESRHLDALAGGAGPNHGNFLDNDQWLSTVSQYDRDKYWNRFRDVSTCATRPWRARSLSEGTPETGLVCVCVWGGGQLGISRGGWLVPASRARSCLKGTLKRTSKAPCAYLLPVGQVCAFVGLREVTALKYCTDHQQLWRKRFSELPTSPNRDGRLCLASEKTSPGQGWRGPSLGCVRRIPAGEVGSGGGPSYLWGSQGLHVCVCVCGGGEAVMAMGLIKYREGGVV